MYVVPHTLNMLALCLWQGTKMILADHLEQVDSIIL